MGKYDDIIDLPCPTSKNHPRMSREDRAAQFAPFAALTGFGGMITETGRYTEERPARSEAEENALNEILRILRGKIELHPDITLRFFRKDPVKDGGEMLEKTGRLRKIEEIRRELSFMDGSSVPVDDIYEIRENEG